MGIKGLLKVLESIANDRHLSSYRGKRIAVDGYCWLHKSVHLLTDEILINPNSKKYLIYLIRRLEQLLKYNITPVIIFDGDKLPMKKNEEEERANHRREVMEKCRMLLNQGLRKEAQTKLIEGIDISPLMAYEFILELKKRRIEYYVAPYEADAQLAYLSKIDYVDCVITEDSDLIALACKKVLYKLDFENDMGKEIVYSDIKKCKEYSFELFDDTKFLSFCILAGCDYFKLKGVGTKNAYNAIKNQASFKDSFLLLKDKRDNITNQTLIDFEKAFISFRHQVVYCPKEKKMRYMNSLESSEHEFIYKYLDDLSFLGRIYEGDITNKIVFGEIDPITHKPLILNPKESTIGLPQKITPDSLKEHFNLSSKSYFLNNSLKASSNNRLLNHKSVGLSVNHNHESKANQISHKSLSEKFLKKKRERDTEFFDKEFFLDIELDMRNSSNDNDTDNKFDNNNKKKDYKEEAKKETMSNDSIISIHSSKSISLNNAKTFKKQEDLSNDLREDDKDEDSMNEFDEFSDFLKSYTVINNKLKDGHLTKNAKIFMKNNMVSITEEEENGSEVIKEKKKPSGIDTLPQPSLCITSGFKSRSFIEQYKYKPNE